VRKPWLFPLLLSLSLVTMPLLAVGQTIDELFQQGKVAIESRNYSQAESIYRQAIQLYPNNAGAYYGLGIALRDQKKLEEAIASYRRAIQLDPNNAAAYYGVGIALRDQKKLEEAIASYRRAIQLDPNNAAAYIGLGIALFETLRAKAAEILEESRV